MTRGKVHELQVVEIMILERAMMMMMILPCSRVLFQKQVVAQFVTEPEDTIHCTRQPAIDPYPEPDESSQQPHISFL